MSKRTTTKTASTAPTASTKPQATARPGVAFQPFQWLRPEVLSNPAHDAGALRLLGRSLDVVQGVGVIFQMIEQHQLDAGYEDRDGNPSPTAIDDCTAGELMRLAISASQMLAEDIWDYHERLNDAVDDPA